MCWVKPRKITFKVISKDFCILHKHHVFWWWFLKIFYFLLSMLQILIFLTYPVIDFRLTLSSIESFQTKIKKMRLPLARLRQPITLNTNSRELLQTSSSPEVVEQWEVGSKKWTHSKIHPIPITMNSFVYRICKVDFVKRNISHSKIGKRKIFSFRESKVKGDCYESLVQENMQN